MYRICCKQICLYLFHSKMLSAFFIRSKKIIALTASRATLWMEEKSILGTIKGYQFCSMLYKYSTMQHLHFYSTLHTHLC